MFISIKKHLVMEYGGEKAKGISVIAFYAFFVSRVDIVVS